MKKLLLTIALFAGITTATYAQGEVNVLYLDGTPHVIAMTDIDKIELTKGSINIVKVGGASESIDINKIDKIELKANATVVNKYNPSGIIPNNAETIEFTLFS